MRRLRAVLWRLGSLFRKGRHEQELAEELESHLQMHIEDNLRAGLSPQEARRRALIKLGGLEQTKEICRDRRGLPFLETFLQDLRYGARMLAKNPGFTIVAVATLALGIGANVAVFSVMNAALLRFFPVPDPQQTVYLRTTGFPAGASQTGNPSFTFNLASFEQMRREGGVFSDVMAYVPLAIGKVTVRIGKEPEVAAADMVSGNFFSGLGIRMARGRAFAAEDETQHSQVAVMSYAYWTRRFARNPSVIGQTIYIKSVPFTVIGIAPRGFTGVAYDEEPTDLWIPFQTSPLLKPWGRPPQDSASLYGSSSWWFLMMIGRLQPGMTREQARSQLSPVFQRVAYKGIGKPGPKDRPFQLFFSATGGIEKLRENYASPLAILMAIVAAVLLIACINVAMLLVARNSKREREFGLRTALGASRVRLIRQLITEGLLLVVAGTGLAWILARWGTRVLATWFELQVNVAPDRTVLGFTLVVALVVWLILGIAPAWNASRLTASSTLKASGIAITNSPGRFRSGRVMVALQVALCLVLLVSARLMVRTLSNLESANLGFKASGLLVFGITAPQSLHSDPEVYQFYQLLIDRLSVLPGVESATVLGNRIGSGWSNNSAVFVDGANPRQEGGAIVRWNNVGPDYCRVLGIPLLLGRDVTDADSATAPKVTIINETFAKQYLPAQQVLGHQLALNRPDADQFTIVGLAANSKYIGVREPPMPMAYIPYRQSGGVSAMTVAVRTFGNPVALAPEVRELLARLVPDAAMLQPMTQQAQLDETFSDERVFARLSTVFGLLAALLVAVGLYGTVAYKVSCQTGEIGVRKALGAGRLQILWMILRESLTLVGVGILAGLPVAVACARALQSLLFGVGFLDPTTFVAAPLGITAVALLASYIPAYRAAGLDPMQALRHE